MRSTNTSKNPLGVHPVRLFAASEAILAAAATGGSVLMWRNPSHPERVGFSSWELCEALEFLRRLGLVKRIERRPATK